MNVGVSRPSARLAGAAAGVFLALVASAPLAGALGQTPRAANPPGQGPGARFFQAGVAALNAKDYAAAEQAFRQCRELDPAYLACLTNLAGTYIARSLPDEAIRLVRDASAAEPANRELSAALANLYVLTGKWDAAISLFQKLLDETDKATPAAGQLYLALGETCRRKGDMPSAIAALRNARSTLPDDPVALATLAMALESASSWEAPQAYEDALRVAPNNPVLLNNFAFSLAEHGGDLDRALALARRARELLPTMPDIADTLGTVYLKKKMPAEAEATFAPLVQQQPGNAAFRAHLAAAIELDGSASLVVQALAKALREEPTDANRRLVLELLKNSGLPIPR